MCTIIQNSSNFEVNYFGKINWNFWKYLELAIY